MFVVRDLEARVMDAVEALSQDLKKDARRMYADMEKNVQPPCATCDQLASKMQL